MNSPTRSPASPPTLPMTLSQAEAATATATASEREEEQRRKAKENLDVGAGGALFGFAALLSRFYLPNKGHQGGGNGNARLTTASLLLSFATFLSGKALMLLSLTMLGRPDLASAAHHVAAKCLVAACAGLSVLTLLSFLTLVPGGAFYMYVGLAVVTVAVALAAGVHRYLSRRAGQQADDEDDGQKEELDAASKITSAVTTSAFGGLIGVLPNASKISGAAAAETDVAIFFLFATATLGVFVLTVSKKVPEITNPRFRRLLVTIIRLSNAFLLCSLACAASAAAFVVLRFRVFATLAPLLVTGAVCFLLRHCVRRGRAAAGEADNQEMLKAMEDVASKVTMATFGGIMGVLGASVDEKDEGKARTMGAVMLVLASAFVSGFGFMALAAAPSSARALLAPVAKVLQWSSAWLFLATAAAVYGVVVGTL